MSYLRPRMQLWLCPLIAFLLGSIPFGLLIAKSKGVDIRQHGSGNIGATNVLRVMGKKYGITCLLLDMLKGLVPTVLAITLIRFTGQPTGMSIAPLLPYAQVFPAEQQFTAQLLVVLRTTRLVPDEVWQALAQQRRAS